MKKMRKPLPEDLNVHAFSAAEIMMKLADQIAMPLRLLINV